MMDDNQEDSQEDYPYYQGEHHQGDINNGSPRKRRGGPLPADMRLVAKKRYLDALSMTNIIQASAEKAGVSRQTISDWEESGFLLKSEIDEARKIYLDMIRGEVLKQMVLGTQRPLVQDKKVVLDKEGNPVMITQRDPRLLWELAKKVLPEYKDEPMVMIGGPMRDGEDIPEAYRLVIDARELTDEEFTLVSMIVKRIKEQKNALLSNGHQP